MWGTIPSDAGHLIRAEGDIKECATKSAQDYRQKIRDNILSKGIFENMLNQPERLHEISLMYFLRKNGLRWNAESDKFEVE